MDSKRLKEIASLVKKNSIVADIGTDHGYIPVYLIENNISKKVIGTDISKGSLDKIIKYVDMKGLNHKIDTRLGNGLETIKAYEVDTVIIAGMGGLLMRDILNKDLEITHSINNFILQPMIGVKELREYLINNNFKIIHNRLLKEDGKFYEIIHAEIGKDYVEDEFEYEIPRQFIEENHPLLKEYIDHKLNYSKGILFEIEGKEGEAVEKRKKEIRSEINRYEEVLKEIES